jgi:spore coat polysaccharide biosynthesis protein SpsF
MKVTAIIQARMGSTRLPGKVLMELGGETVLCRVVRRLRRASMIQEVAVATTESARDEPVIEACRQLGVAYFRGSEQDVLDRYFRAAQRFGSDAVVRITSDCPLIDPELVDRVIDSFVDHHADFACNVLPRKYPRGLDTEVFTAEALKKAWQLSDQPHQREHVTSLFYERPDIFRHAHVCGEQDYSRYRWTLDTPDDLCLIRAIYSHFDYRDDFGWQEVLALIERLPELASLNAHIVQKPAQANESAQVS